MDGILFLQNICPYLNKNFNLNKMEIIKIERNTIICEYLNQIRDKYEQLDRHRFKSNIERIGILLAYEASKHLDYRMHEVETQYCTAQNETALDDYPVLYTIVRAGQAMTNGVLSIFDKSDCGYFCAAHVHTPSKFLSLLKAPLIENKNLIIVDPIIATGESMKAAIESIIDNNGTPKRIIILSIISTPIAIELLKDILPSNAILITCAIDEFNPKVRGTRPGVGDFGDLLYGFQNKQMKQ